MFNGKPQAAVLLEVPLFKTAGDQRGKKGIIITRRVSEGFTETLVKRYSSIPHLRFGL